MPFYPDQFPRATGTDGGSNRVRYANIVKINPFIGIVAKDSEVHNTPNIMKAHQMNACQTYESPPTTASPPPPRKSPNPTSTRLSLCFLRSPIIHSRREKNRHLHNDAEDSDNSFSSSRQRVGFIRSAAKVKLTNVTSNGTTPTATRKSRRKRECGSESSESD